MHEQYQARVGHASPGDGRWSWTRRAQSSPRHACELNVSKIPHPGSSIRDLAALGLLRILG